MAELPIIPPCEEKRAIITYVMIIVGLAIIGLIIYFPYTCYNVRVTLPYRGGTVDGHPRGVRRAIRPPGRWRFRFWRPLNNPILDALNRPDAPAAPVPPGSQFCASAAAGVRSTHSAEPAAPRRAAAPCAAPESAQGSTVTPLSPEIIARQATINIGTIRHIAHGKSTVVKAISDVQTAIQE